MQLFVCDKCDHVDADVFAYPQGTIDEKGEPLKEMQCTECQTGQWHELFEKEKYRPEFDIVINRETGIGLG